MRPCHCPIPHMQGMKPGTMKILSLNVFSYIKTCDTLCQSEEMHLY